MNTMLRLIFVMTGLSPVALTYSALLWENHTAVAIWLLACAVGFVLICGLIVFAVKRVAAVEPLKVAQIRAADDNVLAFIIAYLLPLFSQEALAVNLYTSAVIVVLLALALFTSNSYHYNPVLTLLFGLHHYEVTTESGVTYVLITRRTLNKTNELHQCIRISPYLFMEK